jgi:hypothetical protein
MTEATKTLPPGYTARGSIDLQENQRALIILNIASLPVLLLAGWLMFWFTITVRPELSAGSFQLEGLEILGALAGVVLLMALMITLHEAIHGLFFWLFTRERPFFGLKTFYAYAAAPDWYIPRGPYLVVGLAPLVVITLLGMALVPVAPPLLLAAVLLVVVANAAGAVGDIAVVGWLLLQRRPTLVCDKGDAITIYQPAAPDAPPAG